MSKYAIFNNKGLPVVFYDDDIHQNIPSEAILISENQWEEFINNQGKRAYVNGQIIDISNKVWDNSMSSWRDKTQTEIINEIKDVKFKGLLSLEKQRVNEVINKYNYLSLADVQFYANQNDTEAQAILNWYLVYDDLVWNWINAKLSTYSDVNTLQTIDVKAIEQNLFNQSITTSPLP